MDIEVIRTAIYFDSSVLRGSGWPAVSHRLRAALVLAAKLKIDAVLLNPVKDELEQHYMREYRDALAKEKVSSVLEVLSPGHRVEFPSINDVGAQFNSLVEKTVTETQFTCGKITTRTLREVFQMAIAYEPLFKQSGEGAGFQDTVILLSTIDHAKESSVKKCFLVSSDGFINSGGAAEIARKNGIDLEVLDSVEKLLNTLEDMWKSSEKSTWEAANERARLATESILPQIRAYLDRHLEIPERSYRFSGKVLEIKRLLPKRVIRATTPIQQPEVDQIVTFTADVEIAVTAVVEPNFPFFQALAGKSIKKKQGLAEEGWLLEALMSKSQETSTETPWSSAPREMRADIIVNVEIAATVVKTGYINLQPVGARVHAG
jgi:hypothetical protein